MLSRHEPMGSADGPGQGVAAVLSGAWRPSPPPLELSPEELNQVAPLLVATGAGALGWWRVRNSELPRSPALAGLQQTYRLYAIQALLRERDLARLLELLRSRGVNPLLVKGWAIARVYPEPGLRPYGDVDLYVRPQELEAVRDGLRDLTGLHTDVDLHASHNFPFDRSIEELYAGSKAVPLGGLEVRIPGPEDHLRLLCLHMLYHGMWRPLWLCDVAAAVESLPAEFDWDRFLSGNRRYTHWALCAIGLAHRLLGARLEGTPVAERATRLPHWLAPAALRQWGMGTGSSLHGALAPSLIRHWRHPAHWIRLVKRHWRNPIEASVELGAPFNGLPRLPIQLAAALLRLPRVGRDLASSRGR